MCVCVCVCVVGEGSITSYHQFLWQLSVLMSSLTPVGTRFTHTCVVFSYQVIEEDGTQANSARVGEVLVKELLKLREEFEVVGDVRGKGLMLGVELVKSKVR